MRPVVTVPSGDRAMLVPARPVYRMGSGEWAKYLVNLTAQLEHETESLTGRGLLMVAGASLETSLRSALAHNALSVNGSMPKQIRRAQQFQLLTTGEARDFYRVWNMRNAGGHEVSRMIDNAELRTSARHLHLWRNLTPPPDIAASIVASKARGPEQYMPLTADGVDIRAVVALTISRLQQILMVRAMAAKAGVAAEELSFPEDIFALFVYTLALSEDVDDADDAVDDNGRFVEQLHAEVSKNRYLAPTSFDAVLKMLDRFKMSEDGGDEALLEHIFRYYQWLRNRRLARSGLLGVMPTFSAVDTNGRWALARLRREYDVIWNWDRPQSDVRESQPARTVRVRYTYTFKAPERSLGAGRVA